MPWQAKYVALALIWGASFLFMKLGLAALAPVQIAAWRITCGFLTLLVLALMRRVRLPRGAAVWGHLQVSALFLGTLPFTLFALSETRVSSALAGVGNAITPVATVICSLLILRTESLPWHKIAGVLVGFVGVAIVLAPWQASGRPDAVGFGMALAGGASYAVGWTYNRRFLGASDLGGLAQPMAVLLVAAGQMVLVVLAWWALTGRGDRPAPWSLALPLSQSVGALAAVTALGVLGTGIAYAFQFDVVRVAGPTVSSTVTYLIPLVSIALGVVLLGESLGWAQLAGATVIIGAALLVQRPARAALPVRPRDPRVRG